MTIPLEDITGLVLAGGRGSRMGGVDKGLQLHRGMPLVQHALQRLRPQVGSVLVNANRNLAAYAAFDARVVADALAAQPGPLCEMPPDALVPSPALLSALVPDFHGPLAGWLAGLEHCRSPYLASVPCDAPDFPADLVQRLAAALLAEGAEIAMACSRDASGLRRQPVFCLLQARLRESLRDQLAAGQRKVDGWTARHRCVEVVFDDVGAFFNINTLPELQPAPPGQAGAPRR